MSSTAGAATSIPSRQLDAKVVVLGDSGVGKTSISRRFVNDHFRDYQESTIGASFLSKTLVLGDTAFRFQIWDTAGQEKYRGLAPMYYRNAAAALIVYDITESSSFETLKRWVDELASNGPANIVMAVVGNKTDLEENRQVSVASAQQFAKEINAVFFECSAKSGVNVNEIFHSIGRRLPVDGVGTGSTALRLGSGGDGASSSSANGGAARGKCC